MVNTIVSIPGYVHLYRSLLRFYDMPENEVREMLYLLNTANLDCYEYYHPERDVIQSGPVAFSGWLEHGDHRPYRTEVQLYKSLLFLKRSIDRDLIVTAQREALQTLRCIISNLEYRFYKAYGMEIEDKRTVYGECTYHMVPRGDTGLTGRKIVVDTYGGAARHGGGAFSGKDPTKVDRSASYAARYVAKNLVAAGLARRCEIQIAYAIGVAKPVSVSVDTFGTGAVPDDRILELVEEHFDLRPSSIIRGLGLQKPIYRPTAVYGHFGRKDLQLPWEWTDKAAALRGALAKISE